MALRMLLPLTRLCRQHVKTFWINRVITSKTVTIMARSKQQGRMKSRAKKSEQKKGERGNYPDTPKSNELFERYYKAIGLVPENEWEAFMNMLRQPLPITFRITVFRGEAKELLKIVKGDYLNELSKVGEGQDGENCQVQQLQWYPDELGWQINLTRKEVRQDTRLQKLKDFLVNETESGNISRQEAVSMIPPLVADVQSHHKVLDMCAAPGSKTAQLIESLHSGCGDSLPDGYVVANDKDNKRCYLMTHQVKRLQTPCCAIINHDASILPNMREGEEPYDFVKYDRVLCDVPCSGDGTMRKNIDIWSRWNINQGISLHVVQSKILKRGLELLKVGGRLVYSTCSFNPVENEAVVSHLLKMCQGCVELVDVSQNLPGLKFIPGLLSWKLFVKENKEWIFIDKEEEGQNKQHLRSSMFPPPLEETKKLGLEKCMRVLPHHQNSGGFFIAVLEKKTELPWLRKTSESKDTQDTKLMEGDQNTTSDSSAQGQSNNKKRRLQESEGSGPPAKQKFSGFKEDPFIFMTPEDPILPSVKEYFGIPETFPFEQIMYRTETGKRRTLYFVSDPLRNIVMKNRDRVKFVNLGVKLLQRSPSPLVPQCDFRICQEGKSLSFAFPSRVIQMKSEDMKTLLSGESPFFDRFSKECKDNLRSKVPGSILFWFKPSESDSEPSCEIIVCGWRGNSSARVFLGRPEREHYLRLFGIDFEEYLQNKKKEKEEREEREGVDEGLPEDVDQQMKKEDEKSRKKAEKEAKKGEGEEENEDEEATEKDDNNE